jgi:hypothetical protein
MITTRWLVDAIDSALSPFIPEVRNAEGDELLFCNRTRWASGGCGLSSKSNALQPGTGASNTITGPLSSSAMRMMRAG